MINFIKHHDCINLNFWIEYLVRHCKTKFCASIECFSGRHGASDESSAMANMAA